MARGKVHAPPSGHLWWRCSKRAGDSPPPGASALIASLTEGVQRARAALCVRLIQEPCSGATQGVARVGTRRPGLNQWRLLFHLFGAPKYGTRGCRGQGGCAAPADRAHGLQLGAIVSTASWIGQLAVWSAQLAVLEWKLAVLPHGVMDCQRPLQLAVDRWPLAGALAGSWRTVSATGAAASLFPAWSRPRRECGGDPRGPWARGWGNLALGSELPTVELAPGAGPARPGSIGSIAAMRSFLPYRPRFLDAKMRQWVAGRAAIPEGSSYSQHCPTRPPASIRMQEAGSGRSLPNAARSRERLNPVMQAPKNIRSSVPPPDVLAGDPGLTGRVLTLPLRALCTLLPEAACRCCFTSNFALAPCFQPAMLFIKPSCSLDQQPRAFQ